MPVEPKACIERKPTTQSVLFCGRYINLSHISLLTGLSLSVLSRVFSGKRNPSFRTCKKIAGALKMSLGQFMYALEKHILLEQRYREKLEKVG